MKLKKNQYNRIKNQLAVSGEHILSVIIETKTNDVIYEVYSKTYGEETFTHCEVAIDRFNQLESEEN